jgi:hypothetical protein
VIGRKRSPAQITNYSRDELEGRLVVAARRSTVASLLQ